MLTHPQFDPVALSIGPVAIYWYGLTSLAAFGLFLWLASLRVSRPPFAQAGWTRRDVEVLLFYGVLGRIVFSNAFFLPHGTPNTAPAACESVVEGG